jgi:hypothetical protein
MRHREQLVCSTLKRAYERGKGMSGLWIGELERFCMEYGECLRRRRYASRTPGCPVYWSILNPR